MKDSKTKAEESTRLTYTGFCSQGVRKKMIGVKFIISFYYERINKARVYLQQNKNGSGSTNFFFVVAAHEGATGPNVKHSECFLSFSRSDTVFKLILSHDSHGCKLVQQHNPSFLLSARSSVASTLHRQDKVRRREKERKRRGEDMAFTGFLQLDDGERSWPQSRSQVSSSILVKIREGQNSKQIKYCLSTCRVVKSSVAKVMEHH